MKNFFGIILSILIVPIFIILVIYFSTSNTLLNAKTIPNIFDKNQLYNTIVNDVLPDMTQDQASATAIETKNIDPTWLKTQIEKIYPALTDYLKGNTVNLNVTIDLSPLSNIILNTSKDSVTSLIPEEELKAQFNAWSECSGNQTSNCRPPGMSFEDFKKMVDEEIAQESLENNIVTSSPIPNSYTLSSTPTEPTGNAINTVKQSLGLTNIIAYITSAIIVFLLLVIFFLFMREKAKLLKFYGVIFMVSAILLLLFSGGYLFSWKFIASTITAGFNLPTQTINILINILGAITSNIMTTILITSVVTLAISIICLVFSKKLHINIKK